MKTVIIEDEILAAQNLEILIRKIDSEVEILCILQSIEESIEWFQIHTMPDLVFMDIHLADGSSFAIFDEVKISCPIIFTTAYNEYALKAFEVNSIDYLLKPINEKDLQRALSKYKKWTKKGSDSNDLINKLLSELKQTESIYKSYFLVPEKDKLIPLAVKDIAYTYIDTKTVKIITFNGKIFFMNQTLDELMEQLNPNDFFRANRQYIISHHAVKEISIWFASKILISLSVNTPDKIVISKARVSEFKKWYSK